MRSGILAILGLMAGCSLSSPPAPIIETDESPTFMGFMFGYEEDAIKDSWLVDSAPEEDHTWYKKPNSPLQNYGFYKGKYCVGIQGSMDNTADMVASYVEKYGAPVTPSEFPDRRCWCGSRTAMCIGPLTAKSTMKVVYSLEHALPPENGADTISEICRN